MAYSEKQKEELLQSIFKSIENGKSLRKALIEVKLSSKTFYEWIDLDDEKVKQYARATEERAEALLDEMLDIVDDTHNDIMEMDLGDGIVNTKVNHEVIQRSRLKYDARRWLISKLNPKKYGDKSEVDVTSKGEKITSISIIDIDGSSI
jgi:hypothetical protein